MPLTAKELARIKDGATFTQIAAERGCSREYVRQVALEYGLKGRRLVPIRRAKKLEQAASAPPTGPLRIVWDEALRHGLQPLRVVHVQGNKHGPTRDVLTRHVSINGWICAMSYIRQAFHPQETTLQKYGRVSLNWPMAGVDFQVVVMDTHHVPRAFYVIPRRILPVDSWIYIPLFDIEYKGHHSYAFWQQWRDAWHQLRKPKHGRRQS